MYRKVFKPMLDFIVALLGIIILSPLFLIIMLVTWIDLGLPLYNLKRMREGKNKIPFLMYKFRTKKLDADGTTNSNTYTKVSKWIDRSRLNELPQLFNVLRGEMSIVGPRPFIPGDINNVKPSIKRYLVRPGITGLAQVNGGRSIRENDKLKYDELYYDNMSFALDFKIIIMTVYKLITQKLDKIDVGT